MRRARVTISSGDTALLEAIARRGSVVAAARELRTSRDRATYRLGRLAASLGGPLVVARRGGRAHGTSRLTPLGTAVARRGFDGLELVGARPRLPRARANVLVGTYRAGPPPRVLLAGGGPALRVAFTYDDGARAELLLDQEAVLLAPRRFPSSARNVLAATVDRLEPTRGRSARGVHLRLGRTSLRALVTDETIAELGLAPGSRTFVYVKATSLRPVVRAPSARR